MPIYDWRCRTCKAEACVLRESVDDYKVPPDAKEEAEQVANSQCDHDWEKLISSGQSINKWPGSTGSGKGNWGKV